MKFGRFPIEELKDAILGHSLDAGNRMINKGRQLTDEDLKALQRGGHSHAHAAILEEGDVAEDTAAKRIGRALAGDVFDQSTPKAGRVNLYAPMGGLVEVDGKALAQLNGLLGGISIATLATKTAAGPGQLVATIKIIPFALPDEIVRKAENLAVAGRILHLTPFNNPRTQLILSRAEHTREAVLDKTIAVTGARFERLGLKPPKPHICPHDEASLQSAVERGLKNKCDLILIMGASATVDVRDVVPSAIQAAGGSISSFGMPVDPGNLLLMGQAGESVIIGMPGCARSGRDNGFDDVLARTLAGQPPSEDEMNAMGAGGLLKEIYSRPLPRDEGETATKAPKRARTAAVVLAAGLSRRMGSENKLLIDIEGKPMLERTLDNVRASNVGLVNLVLGHDEGAIRKQVNLNDINCVENPNFEEGMGASIATACRELSSQKDLDAVMVVLGDMPYVKPHTLNKLIKAISEKGERAIIVPLSAGRRGNPVVFGRGWLADLRQLEGDIGARHLLARHPEQIVELEVGDAGVTLDIDTLDALDQLPLIND